MPKAASLLLFFSSIILCDGLDLQFDKIQCDQSLPAYAADGELSVTCSGSKRCSFGDTALISGLRKLSLPCCFFAFRWRHNWVVSQFPFASSCLLSFNSTLRGYVRTWASQPYRICQCWFESYDFGIPTVSILAFQLLRWFYKAIRIQFRLLSREWEIPFWSSLYTS